MEEIWKDIPDYEGMYQVSNLGNVKSLTRIITRKNKTTALVKGKKLKTPLNNVGYFHVIISKNHKQKIITIHQLVAIVFLNHKPDGYNLVINHKNFIRTDNRVENLEITTPRDNSNAKHLKSTSKYTGVHWCKRQNKWIATILINKKKKYIGQFKNEIDASIAYENKLKTIL